MERQKKRDHVCVGSLPKRPQWPGLGQAKAGSFIQFFHMSGRIPSTWNISHCFRWPLAGYWTGSEAAVIGTSIAEGGFTGSVTMLASYTSDFDSFLTNMQFTYHEIHHFNVQNILKGAQLSPLPKFRISSSSLCLLTAAFYL